MTNAHVVAGASTIRATLGSDVVDAVPVLFDPSLDVAVLYAPEPRRAGAPLRDRRPGARGRGRRAGLRGWRAARRCCRPRSRARTRRPATTSTTGDLVTREIIELRAAIEPGDSGGPLVLEDGTVGGLVFAESRTDPEVGLRAEPDAVATRVAPAIGRTGVGRRRGVHRLRSRREPAVPVRTGRYDLPDGRDRRPGRGRRRRHPRCRRDGLLGRLPRGEPAVRDRHRRRALRRHPRATRRRRGPRRPAPGTRTSSPAPAGSTPTRSTPTAGSRLAALREIGAARTSREIDTGLVDWNLDPLEGVPASFLLIPDYQRLETAEDGRRMVARWRAMADVHGPAPRQRCGGASPTGRVACVAPGRADRQASSRSCSTATTADWPLLAPLDDLEDLDDASGWSIADRERFATELAEVVDDEIRPAFVRLHDALVAEILPHARSSSEPGIGHVAGGLDAYRQLIRVHTSLDLDAETLHQVGLRRDRADRRRDRRPRRPDDRGGRASPRPSPSSATDPSLYFSTRDEVFDKAASSLARANEAIPGLVRPPARSPRATSCGWARTRRSTRRSRTTASRRSTARGPASTSSTPSQPDDPAALRGRGPRLPRVRPGPPPPDRDRPGARRTCRSSGKPPRADGVLRGLGPVHRAPGRRDGPVRRRPRPDRRAVVRRLAGRAARRRHRDARARLAARPRDRSSCSSTRPSRPTTSRTRSTATS